jgi:hypothetical protein
MAMGKPSPARKSPWVALNKVLFWTLVLLPQAAGAQQDFNTIVLEPEYRRAQAEYDAAFNALVALEGRLNQALEDLDQARASEDETRMNRAYNLVLVLSGDLREQRRRVDQKAAELREARFQLLQALRRRVDALIAQVDSTRNEEERADLAAILEDANNRRMELLAEEEPETALEPMRDITISPTDLPIDIRRKAATLDYRADQDEARLLGIDRRLEELRQDQRRSRFVSDFLSGLERYGDTRLPVVPPGSGNPTPPDPGQRPVVADSLAQGERPMTLEERIQALEILREELEERIEQIREKAARYRALAGGGML